MDVDATRAARRASAAQEATGRALRRHRARRPVRGGGPARHPLLNSSFDAATRRDRVHGGVNLGLAAQTPRGLLVPVVHGAGRMTLRDAARRDRRTRRGGRDRRLPAAGSARRHVHAEQLRQLGVDGSAAIINHPEAAMLGVGRLVRASVGRRRQLAVRKVTELTLSFDHRVCDGAGGRVPHVRRALHREPGRRCWPNSARPRNLPTGLKPVAGQPVAGQPVAGQPVAGQTVAGRPVAGRARSSRSFGRRGARMPVARHPGVRISLRWARWVRCRRPHCARLR